MATALEQRLRKDAMKSLQDGALEPGRKADRFSTQKELEEAEEGKDLSAETAMRLQSKVGNQTLNAIMNRNNSAPQASSLSVETEEEGGEQEAEEEEDLAEDEEEVEERESGRRQFGGSGGSGGGGGGANPWDVSRLFGDDGEGGGGGPRKRRARPAS